MATKDISATLRPTRIGLVVRAGDIGDLTKAAGIASLLWGGIRNPIIPVASAEDPAADQLLKLFQVDTLYPVAGSMAIAAFLQRHMPLSNPHTMSHDILQEDWRTKKRELVYLDSLHVIERNWHDPSRTDIDHPAFSPFLYLTWEDADPLAPLFALMFGFFPADLNLADDFAAAFQTGLNANVSHIRPADAVSEHWAGKYTPINMTTLELTGLDASVYRDGSGLYVGDPANFTDLVNFWNLRASGASIKFLPIPALERFEAYAQACIKLLDEKPHAHPNIPDLITFSCGSDETLVGKIVDRFQTKKDKGLARCSEANWNGHNIKPATFRFSEESATAHIDEKDGRYSVTVVLPAKRFLPESQRDTRQQCLSLSLVSFGEPFDYPGHTLKPPFRPDLNEFYSRRMASSPWRVRSEHDSIGLLIRADDNSITVSPISRKAVVEELLRRAGIRTEPSYAGLLTDRLLEKLDGVRGARVFKIRGVRRLIDSLAATEPVTRPEATKCIFSDKQFVEHESLYIEPRDVAKLTSDHVFDFLLRKEFFRAGLELKCNQCHLESWQSLRQIDDIWVCEFCGHRNLTSLHIGNRNDWKFRKSGLFAKDNNQEGAIPVILSLLVLHNTLRFREFATTSLNLSFPGCDCEADFMVVNTEPRSPSDLEWVIGEAKSEGGCVDSRDIANMKLVREKLEKIGVTCYLAFSKTADSFRPDEIALFKTLEQEDIPIILLTNREVEPDYPYKDDGKVQFRYANSLSDMARNSVLRYLRTDE